MLVRAQILFHDKLENKYRNPGAVFEVADTSRANMLMGRGLVKAETTEDTKPNDTTDKTKKKTTTKKG